MPEVSHATIVVIGTDAILAEHVRKRSPQEWTVTTASSWDELSDTAPSAFVADLTTAGDMDAIREWKVRAPATYIAGSLVLPKKEIWEAAEQAGADLVANRGAFMVQFVPKFREWLASPGGRRIRLFSMADVAGRLGVVHRMVDPKAGPIAVYHVKGSIFAAQDTCPHAGRLLSEGELDDAVITCPGHGSQFDVRDGTRVRGPADGLIATYRIAVEQQEVFLVFESE